MFIFSCGMAAGQATHTITLNVDMDALLNSPNAAAASYFTVGPETEVLDNSSAENFTVLVDVGDNIVWNGMSTSGSEAVKIKKIKYKRGARIFSSDEVDGEANVEASVIRGSTATGYVYTLQFQVGESNRVYSIDPIIKTKQ
ncbi:MAG: hypothetical protein WBN18_05285 [Flavobacteriaceae bacterium]